MCSAYGGIVSEQKWPVIRGNWLVTHKVSGEAQILLIIGRVRRISGGCAAVLLDDWSHLQQSFRWCTPDVMICTFVYMYASCSAINEVKESSRWRTCDLAIFLHYNVT